MVVYVGWATDRPTCEEPNEAVDLEIRTLLMASQASPDEVLAFFRESLLPMGYFEYEVDDGKAWKVFYKRNIGAFNWREHLWQAPHVTLFKGSDVDMFEGTDYRTGFEIYEPAP